MTMRYATLYALTLLTTAAPLLAAGCATTTIPNTTVSDTAENREVLTFMEEYRHAVEARDVGKILSLASPRYLDDNGTPTGSDDIDFDRLREKLQRWADGVPDVRYEIHYRRVTRRAGQILVDYRYTASYRLANAEGEDRWSRRLNDNRIVLMPAEEGTGEEGAANRESSGWLAISGF